VQRFKLQNRGKSLRPSQLMLQKMAGYLHRQCQRKTHILKSDLATQAIRTAISFKNNVKG
jgi:hypothetical protein